MKQIIVAGGKGERLRPITNTIPKPMIEVGGKSILEHTINLSKKNGITQFIIALCYKPEVITNYFGNGKKFGVEIEYTYEDDNNPMGTAGALLPAKKYIPTTRHSRGGGNPNSNVHLKHTASLDSSLITQNDNTFVVCYADILRDLDVKKMIEFHKKNSSFATINVYKRYGNNPKSMVVFDKENKIEKFIERPSQEDIKEDFVWANGSFYIFEPEIYDYIPTDKSADFGKDIFPQLIRDKKSMFAFSTEDYFIDIGNLEKLEKARADYKKINTARI